MTLTVDQVIEHTRNRSYMSGVQRDTMRVKETQEVFTPTEMVQSLLDQLPQELFTDPNQKYIDNSCGDGQFLAEVLIRKIENGIDFETALSTIYGVEMEPDNVELCRERLLCGQEHLRHIVQKNIIAHNSLTYDFSFNGTNNTDAELANESLFTFG